MVICVSDRSSLFIMARAYIRNRKRENSCKNWNDKHSVFLKYIFSLNTEFHL